MWGIEQIKLPSGNPGQLSHFLLLNISMQYRYFVNGLQRSGTNYLQKLIGDNFIEVSHCNSSKVDGAWKHNVSITQELFSKAKAEPNYFLLIYKNPYTWLESICLRTNIDYQRTQTLHGDAKFVEGPRLKHFSIIHVAKTWNSWVHNWLLNDDNIIAHCIKKSVSYESLLTEQSRNLFLESLPFKRLDRHKWNIPKYGSVRLSKNMNADMIKYYLNMKPIGIDQTMLNVYNEHISDEALNVTGYNRLVNL